MVGVRVCVYMCMCMKVYKRRIASRFEHLLGWQIIIHNVNRTRTGDEMVWCFGGLLPYNRKPSTTDSDFSSPIAVMFSKDT